MKAKPRPNLFAADPAGSDRAYRNIRNLEHEPLRSIRAHCEQLWVEYHQHADEHFLSEFPFRFHQRWFEMHLTVALKRAGFDVKSPKPGPDVLIETPARRIWIEATAPTGGDPIENADAVVDPVRPGQSTAFWVPRSNIALRVAQGFADKSKAFADYVRDRIVDPNDVCLIAINVRDIPHAAYDARTYFLAALYGVGDPYVLLDRKTGEVTGSGTHHRPVLNRASGAPVKMQPFVVEDHSHISAVLGSSADVANGPPRLGDDFVMFRNICAARPLPEGAIPLGYEAKLVDRGDDYGVEYVSHVEPPTGG